MVNKESVTENKEIVFKHGKHKGLTVKEVPVEYLSWLLKRTPKPPTYLMEELNRRANNHGSRDAIYAAEVLGAVMVKQATGHRKVNRKARRRMRKFCKKWG